METAGFFYQMPDLYHALVALYRAVAARARPKLTKRPSVIEEGKLALEAGQLSDLPSELVLSLTDTAHHCSKNAADDPQTWLTTIQVFVVQVRCRPGSSAAEETQQGRTTSPEDAARRRTGHRPVLPSGLRRRRSARDVRRCPQGRCRPAMVRLPDSPQVYRAGRLTPFRSESTTVNVSFDKYTLITSMNLVISVYVEKAVLRGVNIFTASIKFEGELQTRFSECWLLF